MNEASNKSIANTTYTTIALVVVILLVVYRSPLLALIPLVTIALSVCDLAEGDRAADQVPGLNFQVINITNIFVIVVLFGAGTDYCLFLIARYREELIRGRSRHDALREAIVQVGGALVASAGTVIVGLGMLWFSIVRQDPVHRPGDRAEPGDRAAGRPDAGARAPALAPGGGLLAVPRSRIISRGTTASRRAWSRCRCRASGSRWPTWWSATRSRSWRSACSR